MNRLKQANAYKNLDTSNNIWQSGTATANLYLNRFGYDANGNIKFQTKYDSSATMIDSLVYHYERINGRVHRNRLYHVNDYSTPTALTDDVKDQLTYDSTLATINLNNNYGYDEIGNLTRDSLEGIDTIVWNVYGKIKRIRYVSGSPRNDLYFDYDAQGNRIAKRVYDNLGAWQYSTYYVRDAQGNVLSTYDHRPVGMALSYKQSEQHIYGSSRLGIAKPDLEMIGALTNLDTTKVILGRKYYELTNHLGNVLTTITDRKIPVSQFIPDTLVNLDFSSTYSPFTVNGTIAGSVAGGVFNCIGSSLYNAAIYSMGTVAGKQYRISFWIDPNSANVVGGFARDAVYGVNLGYTGYSSPGSYSYNFTAGSNNTWIVFENDGATTGDFYIDSVVVVDLDSSNGRIASYYADINSATDYYGFGQEMYGRRFSFNNYRYKFSGKEDDSEIKGTGNSYDYGKRVYDSRLGRFLSIDPVAKSFPYKTVYDYAENTPISGNDLDGLELAMQTYGTSLPVPVTKNSTAKETRTRVQLQLNMSSGLLGMNGNALGVSGAALKSLGGGGQTEATIYIDHYSQSNSFDIGVSVSYKTYKNRNALKIEHLGVDESVVKEHTFDISFWKSGSETEDASFKTVAKGTTGVTENVSTNIGGKTTEEFKANVGIGAEIGAGVVGAGVNLNYESQEVPTLGNQIKQSAQNRIGQNSPKNTKPTPVAVPYNRPSFDSNVPNSKCTTCGSDSPKDVRAAQ